MKRYGLTGGVGMGKSTVAALLQRHGFPILDTDEIARELVEPGQPALEEVVALFGPAMRSVEGRLDRQALAEIVFEDEARRRQLEEVLHPRIRDVWRSRLDQLRAKSYPGAVVVIPLLFETSSAKEFDQVICVACSPATQHERLAARGWSPRQIESRLRAQWPIAAKMQHADYVLWNEAGTEVLEEQARRVFGW